MILLDLQQTVIATFMIALQKGPKGGPGSVDVDLGIFRHIALSSIKSVNNKFKRSYGELVLCCDSGDNWRREVFPYYKANRKKSRDDSFVDWGKVFATMDVLKRELAENFPYRFVKVERCEADDIIGVLAREANESVTIVSGDNDFGQLHRFAPAVRQWDAVRKREVVSDPMCLKRKIIRGDVGDGVPNFLSDDDTLVTAGKRQRPITTLKEEAWLGMEPPEIWSATPDPAAAERNWRRNETLVDLRCTPPELVAEIRDKYSVKPTADRSTVFNYLASNGLKRLLEDVQDF